MKKNIGWILLFVGVLSLIMSAHYADLYATTFPIKENLRKLSMGPIVVIMIIVSLVELSSLFRESDVNGKVCH